MINSGQKWKDMGLNSGVLTLYSPIFETDNPINYNPIYFTIPNPASKKANKQIPLCPLCLCGSTTKKRKLG
jgi:hypothetical protein